MSNERSSIFETFTVQGDSGDNQTLDQFFQDPQVISAPHFYGHHQPQQQNATYIIQPPVTQQQFIQQDHHQTQEPFIIQPQQQQDTMLQQYLPQQQHQAFSSQQQANLIQQLNQQKKQHALQQQLHFQQQQQQNFNQILNPNDTDIMYITNDVISNDNNAIFLTDNTLNLNNNNNNNTINNDAFTNPNNAYILHNNNNNIINNNINNNNNNQKTTIINEQSTENDLIVVQDNNNTTNNNYYDNSCNDFTGVEEVVEELWMSCESHGSPTFTDVPNHDQNVYEFVEADDVVGGEGRKDGEEKMKKKKKKKNLPTCYSLFYRDTQLAIKEQRPDASVHEVTSIVDSMWKQLEPKHRAYYEKLAKVEKSKYKRLLKKEAGKLLKGKEGKKKTGSGTSKKSKPYKQEDERASGHMTCRREGCTLRAIDDARWDKDYCSTQCVVNHCKDVFKAWVLSRKAEAENNEKSP